MIVGKIRVWKIERGSGHRTGFDVYNVQVLQFLSEERVMVAALIGGTPFSVDVDDLTVVGAYSPEAYEKLKGVGWDE